MNSKHFACAISAILLVFPTIDLSADRGGGGARGGAGDRGINNGQNYNQGRDNSDYLRNLDNQRNGAYLNNYGGGYYGGYNEYIDPYPPAGSEPGMTDDSNALYESYQQSNNDSKYSTFVR